MFIRVANAPYRPQYRYYTDRLSLEKWEMVNTHDSVAIFSGGLDSTTLVYEMVKQGYTPHLLSFDYGQRHKKELTYASMTARNLDLRHDIVDLTGITHLISNSALTSGPGYFDDVPGRGTVETDVIEVPEGHYAEDNMKATVVPNRNMIMLSIAAGVAVNNKYRTIGTGVHAGDHFIYPDCRPKFIFSVGQAILQGNEGFHNFAVSDEPVEFMGAKFSGSALPIYAPFLHRSKADIAYRALELGVPLHLTWSCYKGGEKHCGKCGTCVERLEAITDALIKWEDKNPGNMYKAPELGGRHDHTEYEDAEFWRTAVRSK